MDRSAAAEARDLYRILQVVPEADAEVVQAAYRALARKLHPDQSGSEQAMKELNAAWDVLGNPHQRARYDRERGRANSNGGAPAETRPSAMSPPGDPPPGRPGGPVLNFGRYAGWTVGQIARVDREFLVWLHGVPAGTHLRDGIEAALRELDENQRRARNGGGVHREFHDLLVG